MPMQVENIKILSVDINTSFGLCLLILITSSIAESALKNVNLIIEPPAVRRGQDAILHCQYDLGAAPLYTTKYYRGQLEFYRFTPGEFPNTRVFPFPGIFIDVTSSNATHVVVRNVGFGLSGNFSCEVTSDAPYFSTATATGIMQVVELPERRPQLFTDNLRYGPEDVLNANCSTPPSRPRAELSFTINNMVVNHSDVQYIRTVDNLIATRISLILKLDTTHFSSPLHYNVHNKNSVYNSVGSLIIRCSAQIGELYQEYTEMELGIPTKDSTASRVTLSSGVAMTDFFSSYFTSAAGNAYSPVQIKFLLTIVFIAMMTANGTTFEAFAAFAVQLLTNYYKLNFVVRTYSSQIHVAGFSISWLTNKVDI